MEARANELLEIFDEEDNASRGSVELLEEDNASQGTVGALPRRKAGVVVLEARLDACWGLLRQELVCKFGL
jgi:hypothetical protein